MCVKSQDFEFGCLAVVFCFHAWSPMLEINLTPIWLSPPTTPLPSVGRGWFPQRLISR